MRTLRISEIKDRNENNEITLRRIARNYPSMANNFYRIFVGAKIADVSNVGTMIAKMGETLHEMGLITLWDSTKVNVSTYTLEQNSEDENLFNAYTDHRTNRANESGTHVKMSVTTPLNNKTTDAVDMHFRFKTDRYMLAYVTAKLFLAVLDNLCYSDMKISMLNIKMGDNIAKLKDVFAIEEREWENIVKMF